MDHRDITTIEQVWTLFPRPWRVVAHDGDCCAIVAANDEPVVITDSGFYPPDKLTAQIICDAVNDYGVDPERAKGGTDGA